MSKFAKGINLKNAKDNNKKSIFFNFSPGNLLAVQVWST